MTTIAYTEEIKLPKVIKVACFDIKVVEWEKHTGTAARRWGEFSYADLEIRIDTSSDKYNVLNTFMHELGHAIYWAYSILEDDKEERIVDMFATGYCQVMRDNPKVIELINRILVKPNLMDSQNIDIDKIKAGYVMQVSKDE